MSDDKKYTLDDILAEYNSKDMTEDEAAEAAEKTAEIAAEATETEAEAPETTETAEIAAEVKETEEFPEAAEETAAEAETEIPETAETDSGEDAGEEVFADESDDGDEEIEQELLEDISAENDEESVTAEVSAEAVTWADSGISEEINNIDIPEETEEDPEEKSDKEEISKEENSEEEPAKEQISEEGSDKEENSKEETAAEKASEEETEEISGESEDVNDKWLKKTAKNIFPVKGDSIGEIIRKIIFMAASVVFIGAGAMLISTLIQSRAALKDKDKNKDIITTTLATYIDENGNVVYIDPTDEEIAQHNFNVAQYYKGINKDYVGYLEVEGCDIYEPVVQGEDNDYYLRINISGGSNKAGTVFMDYRCTVSEDYVSPNIVLYGHNQEDGTMFGNLKEYKQNVEFYKEHPLVKFSSEFETGEYLIYGFFVTHVYPKQDSNGEVFHYHDYIETLNDEYTFNWYINEIQKRNQIISPVDIKFGDKLLCLSTCSNEFTDSRFVVFARKLREGESAEDYDFSEAYMNPNAKGVDWDAIMSGERTSPTETEVIDDIDDDPGVTTWSKSNSKTNSGNGSKNDGRTSITPPPPETEVTTTTASETETKKKKTTTKAETTTEASESEEKTSGTEAPVQEGSETETAS